jgi:NADH:ubiquinone oxidoreductase subunit D
VPDDFADKVTAFLVTGRKTLGEMEGMLNRNKIFRDRTIGVNVLTKRAGR